VTGDTAQQEKGEYRWAASPVASDADVLICALQVISTKEKGQNPATDE